MTKVFGVGFQKTGTTSLGAIFRALDYKIASYDEFRHLADRETLDWPEVEELAIRVARDVDAAKDTPWPLLYRQLDAAFPGSKFIHVIRNSEAWLKSAQHDFQDYPNALHRLIYGSNGPKGHEIAWVDRYEAHNEEVAAYFADRPDDYLMIRLEDGVTFEKVCGFLDEPLVGTGAPRANQRGGKDRRKMWRKVRRALGMS